MEMSGQFDVPAAYPWYPLDRKLGEPQSLSGRGGEEKNPFRESNRGRPARSLVTILNDLSRLSAIPSGVERKPLPNTKGQNCGGVTITFGT
jgi:hypothetical protein